MGLILAYLLFALTTGLATHYELISPTLSRLKKFHPGSAAAEMYWAHSVLFLMLNILVAPVMFFVCIVPAIGERFKDSLYSSLKPL